MIARIDRLLAFIFFPSIVLFLVLSTLPASSQISPDFLIQRMDSDGDGRISAQEFIGRRRPFSFFDQNGDGYATREEIEAAMGAARSRQLPQTNSGSSVPAFLLRDEIENLLIDSRVSHISPRGRQVYLMFKRDGVLHTVSPAGLNESGEWHIKGRGALCVKNNSADAQYDKDFCVLVRREGNKVHHYKPKTRERIPTEPWLIETPGPKTNLVRDN